MVYAGGMDDQRPILALDVDGVISLFGFQGPLEQAPGRFHLIDGMAHCIPHGINERLSRLRTITRSSGRPAGRTGPTTGCRTILGLPGELPFLTFDGNARFGSAHWKIEAIDRYAGDRRLAWVDDCIDETCQAWAVERSAPTLLVPTESDVGLTDAHLKRLLNWARAGYTA